MPSWGRTHLANSVDPHTGCADRMLVELGDARNPRTLLELPLTGSDRSPEGFNSFIWKF